VSNLNLNSETANATAPIRKEPAKVKQNDLHKERAQQKVASALNLAFEIMEDRNITKSDLSRLMHCYPSFVQAIFDEREGRGLTLQTLERVADALDLEVQLRILLNRPGFCRHLGAMENGLIGGVYEQQAVHG